MVIEASKVNEGLRSLGHLDGHKTFRDAVGDRLKLRLPEQLDLTPFAERGEQFRHDDLPPS